MHAAHVDEVAIPIRPIRPRAGLAGPVVLGAALRVAWLAYARPAPVSDFAHYLRAGLGLLDTGVLGVGGPSAWRLPAYPAVLAAGAVVSRDPLALAALTVALSTLQVGLTWWVAWRAFASRPAAAAAATAAAVAPALVTFAPVLASEHLLAVCVLGAVGAALGRVEPDRRRPNPSPSLGPPPHALARTGRSGPGRSALATPWRTGARRWSGGGGGSAVLAGTLMGIAVLTRAEAVAYVPAVAVAVGAARWRTGGRRPGAALRAAGLAVAATALVVTPWVVRNERVVGPGTGLTTTGGFNFYLAHSPGPYGWRTPLPPPLRTPDEVQRNRAGWRHGLRHVRDHPGDWWPTTRRGTAALYADATYAAHFATVAPDPVTGRPRPRDDLALRPAALELAGAGSRLLLAAGVAGLALAGRWRGAAWTAVVGIAVANWLVHAVVFWAQPRYRFVVDALACVAVGALMAGRHARRPPPGLSVRRPPRWRRG